MERTIDNSSSLATERESLGGWEAWDAVPRDGPAVFVADTAALDQGFIRGCWLEVGADPSALTLRLTDLLGRQPEEGAWAILDQIGLGEVMAPETMSVADLATLTEQLRTDSFR